MRLFSTVLFSVMALGAPRVWCAPRLAATPVEVGQHLLAIATINLEEPAPSAGLTMTITSNDPSKVLLSNSAEGAGKPSISVPVAGTALISHEFYVHGLAREGTATYTARVPGYETATGRVQLAPSGIMFGRAAGVGMGPFMTTTGAPKTEVGVFSMMLDSTLNPVTPQMVAGGNSVTLEITSSDVAAGKVTVARLTIPTGSATASTEFQPLRPGSTTLTMTVPPGFSAPAQFAAVPVNVLQPGMALTDAVYLGKDLQSTGHLHLGEAAPAGGVTVTLKSSDPKKLLLSASTNDVGAESLQIKVPAGGVGGEFVLQALAGEGDVEYTATAPGYTTRRATIALTPSGVVLGGPQGPPDEAELFNQRIAEGPHGFVAPLAAGPQQVRVYTVHLDRTTLRAADLTVQPLRAGHSLSIELKNTNPAAGTLETKLSIPAGSSNVLAPFKPLARGMTEVSVATPAGHTQAKNSTVLTITVTP